MVLQIQNGIRYFMVFWSSTDTQITFYNWHFYYIKQSKISTQSPCNNTDDYMAGENRCHFAYYL